MPSAVGRESRNPRSEPTLATTSSRRASDSVARARSWRAFDLIPFVVGQSRRVEPGAFPLAHGIPNRVGKLRAYGNAIVPQVAAEFITAYLETE